MVEALAGVGKTTTLKQVIKASPEKNFLYACFNTKVKEDMAKWIKKEKIQNAVAMTGDAISRAYVNSKYYLPLELDISGRLHAGEGLRTASQIAEYFSDHIKTVDLLTEEDPDAEVKQVVARLSPVKVVKFIEKAITVFCLSEDLTILPRHFFKYEPTDEMLELANLFWEEYKNPCGLLPLQFTTVFKIFALDKPNLKYNFADRHHIREFDCLLIDEAQDTNPVAGEVYRSQEIQEILVGDPNQAIYGFRGAVNEMQKRTDLPVLPLTHSFRFGEEIARPANAVLARGHSDSQIVTKAAEDGHAFFGSLQAMDAIITRTNAGALRTVMVLIEDGVRPRIPPAVKIKLIGLVNTLGFFAGQLNKPKSLIEELKDYESLDDIKEDIRLKNLSRQVDLLLTEIEKDQLGAKKLLEIIEPLNFRETKDTGPIVLTSHAAKGDEWDTVQVANDFWGPKYNSYEDSISWPDQEEFNILYVALTRAKDTLAMSSSLWWIYASDEEILEDMRRKYRQVRED